MTKDRFSRQSFLGEKSQKIIQRTIVGVPGLGGGGSHIVRQLAHIGFLNYRIYDSDFAEDSNLNRLVGGEDTDLAHKTPKIEIAERMIKGLQPNAQVASYHCRWQEQPEPLRGCDLIFGCVDGFSERRELEALARRYLVPLVDIGMDVHCVEGEPPRMGGQVILSMPGGPCMFCLGFLSERVLKQEGERYGDAGPRPQVVWPNGVLASTAVGVAVDLLTDWTQTLRDAVYLEYDGNKATVKPDVRLKYLDNKSCAHYPAHRVGDPIFRPGVEKEDIPRV
jgi:molybdopterin-synthase adenylyltransferase